MFDTNTKLTSEQRKEYETLIAIGGKEIIVQRFDDATKTLIDESVTIRIVRSLKEYMRAYAAFDETTDPFTVSRFFCVRPDGETPEATEDWLESLIPESVALIEEVARELNFTRVSQYAEPRLNRDQKKAEKNIKMMMEVMPANLRDQALVAFTQASQTSSAAQSEKLLKDAGLSKQP
jgi:hypothetical protein